MSNIIEKLQKEKSESHLWYTSEKRLYVLRTYSYQGNNFIVFFKYRPTVFKVRGEYKTFNVQEINLIQNFIKECKEDNYKITFPIDEDGNPGITSRMPHIPLSEGEEGYLNYMTGENITRNVLDLLDVMDFIAERNGLIYLDPMENINRIQVDQGDKAFKLSDNPEDYERPIVEFVTSTEKPTLSFGFLLLGEEIVDSINIERRRYFTYKVIDSEGHPCIKVLHFILPITQIADSIEYLQPYLENDIEVLPNERIKISINTEKLHPISTIHELPVTLDLIEEREQIRLLMKSNNKFRRIVKDIAKDIGVPIPDRYSNMYNYDKEGEEKLVISCRTQYKNEDTKAGNNSLPKIMKEGSVTDNYIKGLIQGYVSGETDDNHIEENIQRAKIYYKNELISECFAGLFTGIIGNRKLSDMYKNADTLAHGMEYLVNSTKIKLKPFGRYNEHDVMNFMWRMYLAGVKQNGMIDENSFYLEYEDVEVRFITEAKYES